MTTRDNQNRNLESVKKHFEFLRREREKGVERFFSNTKNKAKAGWVVVEGVECLRVEGSKFVGVPCSGRKSSFRFDIINIEERKFVCQLTKNEVRNWLFRN